MRRSGKVAASATAVALIAAGCSSKPSVPEILTGDELHCSRSAEESFAGTIAVSGALATDEAFKQRVLDVSRKMQTAMCEQAVHIAGALLEAYNAPGGGKNIRLLGPSETGTDSFRLVTMAPVDESTKTVLADYWEDIKQTHDGPLNVAGVFGVKIIDGHDGGIDTTDISPVSRFSADAWDMLAHTQEGNGENDVVYEGVTTVTQESELTVHSLETTARLDRIDTVAALVIPGY